MYIVIVALTMLVLPLASIGIEHLVRPEATFLPLMGRWFVFWGVGVRLGLAGARQFLHPGFTAREIFHITGDEALPLVRELGISNLAIGVIALLSVAMPAFVLPAAIYAAIFYTAAGLLHAAGKARSLNETIAMVSDLFIALLLAVFVALTGLRS